MRVRRVLAQGAKANHDRFTTAWLQLIIILRLVPTTDIYTLATQTSSIAPAPQRRGYISLQSDSRYAIWYIPQVASKCIKELSTPYLSQQRHALEY
jgi:hypothetical protein